MDPKDKEELAQFKREILTAIESNTETVDLLRKVILGENIGIDGVAVITGLSPRTIYTLVSKAKTSENPIPHIHNGRKLEFNSYDIRQWNEKRKVKFQIHG